MTSHNKNRYKGFEVLLSKKSKKFLRQFSVKQRMAFIDALDILVTRSQCSDVKKLQGHRNYCRLRVGDYRIIFEPDNDNKLIYVDIIAHRKDVYGKISRLK